jgi:hypothetical protein
MSDEAELQRMRDVAALPREADPLTKWELNAMDRRLLRALRIKVDVEDIWR